MDRIYRIKPIKGPCLEEAFILPILYIPVKLKILFFFLILAFRGWNNCITRTVDSLGRQEETGDLPLFRLQNSSGYAKWKSNHVSEGRYDDEGAD
jgi:hypothetical protein